MDPKNVLFLHMRGICYSKIGDYDKAIADLKKVVEIEPDLLDLYGQIGVVYEIKKDYKSALIFYNSALKRAKKIATRQAIETWIKHVEFKMNKKK